MSDAASTAFADRWVLVTGASSGIGRAIAVELSAAGARVALLGRNAAALHETASLCGPAAVTEIVIQDLAQIDAIADSVAGVARKLGRIYGLCHCAGASLTLPLAATRPDRARALMDVNFHAGLELVRAVTRRDVMTEAGGSLLWMSSAYAHVGAPAQSAYSATKAAIIGASRSLALELAPRAIRVNSLSPGMVRTPMTDSAVTRMSEEQWARIAALHPLGIGKPEDVAHAAVFLLDPRNTWITGADLRIDGGYTIQ
jgi:NAD(P)-dependent dehydrogenase (short-subunit alcohol dehydrogenase family)